MRTCVCPDIGIKETGVARRSLTRRLARMTDVQKTRTEEEALHLLFQLADSDRSGHVDPSELASMLKQLGFVSVSVPRAREVMEGTAGVVYEASGAVTLPEHSFVRSMVSGAMAQALDDKKVARRGRRTVLVKRRTTILPGAKTTEVPVLVPTWHRVDRKTGRPSVL